MAALPGGAAHTASTGATRPPLRTVPAGPAPAAGESAFERAWGRMLAMFKTALA